MMTAMLSSCAHHRKTARGPAAPAPSPKVRERKPPASVPVGYSEEGIASWYGIPFHGRAAADGEIYDMEKLVAAHRVLPFNTWLRVTNLNNGKTADVRVIDRGPFVDGRIIDLSKAAARQIGLLGPGVGPVRIEVISAPADVPSADFYAVQVGAFSSEQHAQALRARYAERFGDARVVPKQGAQLLWRVLVGKESTIEAARQLAANIGAEDKTVFVVRLDPAPNGNPSGR
jgi:rare lipoprotein A